MKFKQLLIITISLILCISMTGCKKEKEEPFMTSDHKILEFEKDNLPESKYYILKKNGKFQPLLQKGVNDTYTWYSKFDNLIPVIEKGDKLIYTSVSHKPYSFSIAKMKSIGYTVGIKFNTTYSDEESKNIYKFPNDQSGYSPYSKVWDIVGTKMENVDTSINDINGKKITSLMFTDDGFLKGLTKDALYQFGYNYGTKYAQIDIKADTHVFTREESMLSNTFKETKKGYIEISLPEGVSSGYYKLEEENGGMFRVE